VGISFYCKAFGYTEIQLLGDSKAIIDWLKKKGNLQAINIEGWKRKTSELVATFRDITFQHIYRETNRVADRLSKHALLTSSGSLFYYPWDGESARTVQHFDIF
jgi:ribonuclease HI